jgi:hypothetical protein
MKKPSIRFELYIWKYWKPNTETAINLIENQKGSKRTRLSTIILSTIISMRYNFFSEYASFRVHYQTIL